MIFHRFRASTVPTGMLTHDLESSYAKPTLVVIDVEAQRGAIRHILNAALWLFGGIDLLTNKFSLSWPKFHRGTVIARRETEGLTYDGMLYVIRDTYLLFR